MMLVSLISYVDRNVLAILAPTIRDQLVMSEADYGWAITCFSIAYMIGNPVWGWVLDRFGLRVGMTAAVLFWTVASAAHATVSGFWGLAIARALLGFGEGATFPGGLRAALESLPEDRQTRGIAISYSGGSLGAILTPLMVTPIAARFGWQSAFLISGAFGAAWLILWWAIARPPYLPQRARRSAKIRWPNFFERRFWALVASYGLGALPLVQPR